MTDDPTITNQPNRGRLARVVLKSHSRFGEVGLIVYDYPGCDVALEFPDGEVIRISPSYLADWFMPEEVWKKGIEEVKK